MLGIRIKARPGVRSRSGLFLFVVIAESLGARTSQDERPFPKKSRLLRAELYHDLGTVRFFPPRPRNPRNPFVSMAGPSRFSSRSGFGLGLQGEWQARVSMPSRKGQ